MSEPPPAKHPLLRLLRKPFFWALALFLAICGYQAWRIYDYRAAVREAKEAGFVWRADDTFDLIRQDWRAALRKETWKAHDRWLHVMNVSDLTSHRALIHRLRPTIMFILGSGNVDALSGLTSLRCLLLSGTPALQNLDALKGLTDLQRLQLNDCPSLQNLDALKSLSGLQTLQLPDCRALQNLDVLNGLPSLQHLDLSGCPQFIKVDYLKNLKGLRMLSCGYTQNISEDTLNEIRAALPKTEINRGRIAD